MENHCIAETPIKKPRKAHFGERKTVHYGLNCMPFPQNEFRVVFLVQCQGLSWVARIHLETLGCCGTFVITGPGGRDRQIPADYWLAGLAYNIYHHPKNHTNRHSHTYVHLLMYPTHTSTHGHSHIHTRVCTHAEAMDNWRHHFYLFWPHCTM